MSSRTLPAVFIPNNPFAPFGAGALAAWCRYCKRTHWHGDQGVRRGNVEMRGAHCTPLSKSPFVGRSYLLKVTAIATTSRRRWRKDIAAAVAAWTARAAKIGNASR